MLSQALCLKSIMCVINTPNMSVRICSKTVLSLLLVIMDDTDMVYLQLKIDEASRLIELLCIATKEGEASEGLLTYTVLELLVSFINLSSLAKNKMIIVEAGIVDPLQLLILNEDYKVQEQSLHLLWTLLSGSQLSTQMVTDHVDLRLMLRSVHESPSITLSLIAQCVLKKIYWDTPEGREISSTNVLSSFIEFLILIYHSYIVCYEFYD